MNHRDENIEPPLKIGRRRAVSVSGEALVKMRPMFPDSPSPLPLLVEPTVEGVDLVAWCGANKSLIEEKIAHHGGILFRGFGLRSVERLQEVVRGLYGDLLEYIDRVQPRRALEAKVYSSTEYPPEQSIEFHNEASYAANWPLKIFFLCLQPSREGGETPIADGRRVLGRLSEPTRRTFAERGLCYVRNMGDGFGISWQTSFQTDDRGRMEEFCRANAVEIEWKGGDRLRTRSVRPAVARHPRTGEWVWFNAAISSHVTTLPPEAQRALLSQYREEDLPKHVFHADGSPIDLAMLEEVREAFRAETVTFTWQAGDLLMLDNMLACHGRWPYRGERKVVVAMAEAVGLSDL